MGVRRRAFFIFSMLVVQGCTCHVKRRSWLGPENFLQIQDMQIGRDSYGFASAGGKIYLFAGLVTSLGMHGHASSSHSHSHDGFFVQLFPGTHFLITLLSADNNLQRFDPEANTWIELSQMTTGLVPPAIAGHRIVSLGPNIYSFGGLGKEGNQPPASLIERQHKKVQVSSAFMAVCSKPT
jgi:hypothetical protein